WELRRYRPPPGTPTFPPTGSTRRSSAPTAAGHPTGPGRTETPTV
ncbi:MAG: hypothetical protein AVDCRST_MAG02-2199, partial [uncultured Rubrobacteraceae bacterium]